MVGKCREAVLLDQPMWDTESRAWCRLLVDSGLIRAHDRDNGQLPNRGVVSLVQHSPTWGTWGGCRRQLLNHRAVFQDGRAVKQSLRHEKVLHALCPGRNSLLPLFILVILTVVVLSFCDVC